MTAIPDVVNTESLLEYERHNRLYIGVFYVSLTMHLSIRVTLANDQLNAQIF
jgi:hypothetical protein